MLQLAINVPIDFLNLYPQQIYEAGVAFFFCRYCILYTYAVQTKNPGEQTSRGNCRNM